VCHGCFIFELCGKRDQTIIAAYCRKDEKCDKEDMGAHKTGQKSSKLTTVKDTENLRSFKDEEKMDAMLAPFLPLHPFSCLPPLFTPCPLSHLHPFLHAHQILAST
jgi:hypothetical protein